MCACWLSTLGVPSTLCPPCPGPASCIDSPSCIPTVLPFRPARRAVASALPARNTGYACIATCAFLLSVQGLAIKILSRDVPTSEIVFTASLFGFLLTWCVTAAQGVPVRSPSWQVFSLTVFRGLLGAASTTCFYLSVALLPLQVRPGPAMGRPPGPRAP